MKSLAKVAVRIMSLYFIAQFLSSGVTQLMGMIFSRQLSSLAPMLSGIASAHIIRLIVAILLWYYADELAELITKDSDDISFKHFDYQEIQVIAFSIVGLVLIIVALPHLAQQGIEYFSTSHLRNVHYLSQFSIRIIQLLIGIYLLIGARSIVKKIQ